MRSSNGLTGYVDEVHFYAEADLRSIWAYRGEPALVDSSSPGRKKVSYYGVYFPQIKSFYLWESEKFNSQNSAEFFRFIREKFPGRRLDLVIDNAPHHKGPEFRKAVEDCNIQLHRLPGYSPELNCIECLWRWFRQEATYNYCHDTIESLRQSILDKEIEFKRRKTELARRLKVDLSYIKHLIQVNQNGLYNLVQP